jgi:hypothetical protein
LRLSPKTARQLAVRLHQVSDQVDPRPPRNGHGQP